MPSLIFSVNSLDLNEVGESYIFQCRVGIELISKLQQLIGLVPLRRD
jgi:hypothetical protein